MLAHDGNEWSEAEKKSFAFCKFTKSNEIFFYRLNIKITRELWENHRERKSACACGGCLLFCDGKPAEEKWHIYRINALRDATLRCLLKNEAEKTVQRGEIGWELRGIAVSAEA